LKRVLVIIREELLALGVESLLKSDKNLNIISSGPGFNVRLDEKFADFQPDVLVLDEKLGLVDLASLVFLIEDCPKLRIVIIREDDNLAQIYDKQEMTITKASDLLAAIQ
jgi:chemotaxis response regulator CheB